MKQPIKQRHLWTFKLGIKQEVGSPSKQIYIAKKKEVLAAPMDAIEQTSLRINSMEALLNEIEGLIVIENLAL